MTIYKTILNFIPRRGMLGPFVNYSSQSNLVRGVWYDKPFSLNGLVLDSLFIEKCINKIWNTFIKDSDRNCIFGVMLKIRCSDSRYLSITKMQIVNSQSSFTDLNDILNAYWNLRIDDYYSLDISELIVSIYLFSDKHKTIAERLIAPDNKVLKSWSYNGYKLPNTTDFTKWGGKLIILNNRIKVVFNDTNYFDIKLDANNKFYTAKFYIKDNLILTFVDTPLLEGGEDDFDRVLDGTKKYVFRGGIVISKKLGYKLRFLTPLKKSKTFKAKILTMDIEAYNDENGFFIPYACGVYDGIATNTWYTTDFNHDYDAMLTAMINSVFTKKYNGYRVYIHNLSRFDGIFLLKIIARIGAKNGNTPKVIYRDGNIMKITLKSGGGLLYFYDSLLLLPSSLRGLGKAFNVNVEKSYFPYTFTTKERLDYIGPVPEYSYFKDLGLKEYNIILSNIKLWNLKRETLLYLEKDIISLHQIILEFSNKMYNNLQVDITKRPTIASIALQVYRTKFLSPNSNIPLTLGNLYKDIKQAYFGGIVDVYKPYGKDLYYYDINSLYSHSMIKDMPVGNPSYVEGELDLMTSFGFYFAEIEAPKGLDIPVLPVKRDGRTLCPTGSFSGWYFSEELKEAQLEYGYKVKIIRGYQYERGVIFHEYINHFYNIKMNASGADRTIAKLMLNSLYGKFGMSPDMETVEIIQSGSKAESKYINTNLSDRFSLGENIELIRYTESESDDERELNISVGLSAAIAAYSRITINRYKYIKGNECFYSDTDSVVLQQPLPDREVGKALGQMKLEYGGIKEGIFLAPKVYGLRLESGETITKIKGLNTEITFNEMKKLLKEEERLKLRKINWVRDLSKSRIQLMESIYTLMVTSNKRRVVYEEGLFKWTKPKNINERE